MIRSLLICTGLLAITACGGGGGKADLVKACMDEGEDREGCECMAQELEEGLSPRAFEAMVLSATGKDEEAEAAMKDLGMTDAIAVAGSMITVATKCGVSGFGS